MDLEEDLEELSPLPRDKAWLKTAEKQINEGYCEYRVLRTYWMLKKRLGMLDDQVEELTTKIARLERKRQTLEKRRGKR